MSDDRKMTDAELVMLAIEKQGEIMAANLRKAAEEAAVWSAAEQRRLRLEKAAPDLLAALEKAETFIADDTCRHDEEKASLLILIRAVIGRAKGARP